ncbi:hypothetical protein REPUB_Repub14bG0061700 [Reevesia pubescens]
MVSTCTSPSSLYPPKPPSKQSALEKVENSMEIVVMENVGQLTDISQVMNDDNQMNLELLWSNGVKAEKVIRSLRFDHATWVDARGFSCGIWVMWNNDLVTAVYVSPTLVTRELLWQHLKNFNGFDSVSWLLIGDFKQKLSRLGCFELQHFHEAVVQNLPRLYGDHCPLLLRLEGFSTLDRTHRPFHFEMAWMLHDDFVDLLNSK